jgi:hypothetical protein
MAKKYLPMMVGSCYRCNYAPLIPSVVGVPRIMSAPEGIKMRVFWNSGSLTAAANINHTFVILALPN